MRLDLCVDLCVRRNWYSCHPAAAQSSSPVCSQSPFIGLEDEMVTWVPLESIDSPNRVDALVWATTELLIDGGTARVSSLILSHQASTHGMP
jgi:phage terminase large subunit-like protein